MLRSLVPTLFAGLGLQPSPHVFSSFLKREDWGANWGVKFESI